MKKTFAMTSALVLWSMLFVSASSATTWYVDGSAVGGDGRSWQTAFNTVQRGVDAASLGDEVWVRRGTYNENIVAKNGVALFSEYVL